MKIARYTGAALLIAVSAHAQTITRTNADLDKPTHIVVAPVTPAVLDGLRARQFTLPPSYPAAPPSIVISSDTAQSGPWTWPIPRPARRLDGTLLSDPMQVYGAPYWFPWPILTQRAR